MWIMAINQILFILSYDLLKNIVHTLSSPSDSDPQYQLVLSLRRCWINVLTQCHRVQGHAIVFHNKTILQLVWLDSIRELDAHNTAN